LPDGSFQPAFSSPARAKQLKHELGLTRASALRQLAMKTRSSKIAVSSVSRADHWCDADGARRAIFAFGFGRFAPIAASQGQCGGSRKRTPFRRGAFGDH
jgi:hypothetical protein